MDYTLKLMVQACCQCLCVTVFTLRIDIVHEICILILYLELMTKLLSFPETSAAYYSVLVENGKSDT